MVVLRQAQHALVCFDRLSPQRDSALGGGDADGSKIIGNIGEVIYVLLRYYQDLSGANRVNIHKGKDMIGFIDPARLKVAADYLAKHAIHIEMLA